MKTGGYISSKDRTGSVDGAFAIDISGEVLGEATTFTEWFITARAGNNPVLGHDSVAIGEFTQTMSM